MVPSWRHFRMDNKHGVAAPSETVSCTVTVRYRWSVYFRHAISPWKTPPTVVATLSQVPIYTDTPIEVFPQYSDVDPTQTVTGTIEWHVVDALTGSDNTVQTDSTTTLDGGLFNKGDQIYAVVTPNDGIEDGSSFTTSSIEVLNTLPSAPVISLGPSNPDIDTDNVTCQVDSPSVDMDSDVIEYTFDWTLLDGSMIQSTYAKLE